MDTLTLYREELGRCAVLALAAGGSIPDVPVRINPRLRRVLGRVRYKRAAPGAPWHAWIVELSAELAGLPEDVARDVVRHELAHLADGFHKGDGHGLSWQVWARRFGARPARLQRDAVWLPARIGYRCQTCGAGVKVGPRSRAAKLLRGGAGAGEVWSRCCRAGLVRAPDLDRATASTECRRGEG